MAPLVQLIGLLLEVVGALVLAWEFFTPLTPPSPGHRPDPFLKATAPSSFTWKEVPRPGAFLDTAELTRTAGEIFDWIKETEEELTKFREWTGGLVEWVDNVDKWAERASTEFTQAFRKATSRRSKGIAGSIVLGVGLLLQVIGLTTGL